MPLQFIPAVQRATHQVAVYLEKSGLSKHFNQAEAHILAHLSTAREVSIAEIHRSFGHKRSTLTSVLDRLERQGLIRRQIHPKDRRSFLIRLTGRGRLRAARVLRELRALERRVARATRPGQRRGFAAVVTALGRAASAGD